MNSVLAPLLHIPVGVVIERRKAVSQWVDYTWRPTAVLPDVADLKPWTILRETEDTTSFYAGGATVELHRAGARLYRENLSTGAPSLWVVMSPSEGVHPFGIASVTADPSEGESFAEVSSYLVEPVPMPDIIRGAVQQFVADHYVNEEFVKRTRDRANPEALGRRQRGGQGE